MARAQLEIVLRNGEKLQIAFNGDEAVNTTVSRLQKAKSDPAAIFLLEMKKDEGVTVTHYLPGTEIVRWSVTMFPRVAATA
jgi:hypothetical protein